MLKHLKALPKNIFIKFFCTTLILLVAVIYSCKKETSSTSSTQQGNPAIKDLKDWYTKSYPVSQASGDKKDLSIINENAHGDLSKIVKPDWSNVASYTKDGIETFEAPLDSNVKLGIVNTDNAAKFSFAKNASKSAYIFLKDGNQYTAFVMLVLADSSYLKGDFKKINNNTFRKYDNDFSGKVVYLTPNGKLVSAWTYSNGKLIGSYFPEDTKQILNDKKAEQKVKTLVNCSTYTVFNGAVCAVSTCTYQYTVYTICTGGGPIQPGRDPDGGLGGGGGTGGGFPSPTTSQQNVSAEIKTDNLNKNFPCAVAKIIGPLLNQANYGTLVSQFQTSQKPTLTWTNGDLDWNKNGSYMLGNEGKDPTSFTGTSRIITLNNAMLQNSSQLLITAAAIHETLHAYIGYNINQTLSEPWKFRDYGSWLAGLDSFYLIKDLPPSYGDHYQMLADYFNQAVGVLAQWDNKQHSQQDYVMAMLYGLTTVDSDCPADMKARINQVYNDMLKNNNITPDQLNSFYQDNLNASSSKRLPTSGCN